MSLADYGDPVENVLCPKCHKYPVVYNGNYFCENYAQCGWAMNPLETSRRKEKLRDIAIIEAYLKQRRIRAMVKGDISEVGRMEHYLRDMKVLGMSKSKPG